MENDINITEFGMESNNTISTNKHHLNITDYVIMSSFINKNNSNSTEQNQTSLLAAVDYSLKPSLDTATTSDLLETIFDYNNKSNDSFSLMTNNHSFTNHNYIPFYSFHEFDVMDWKTDIDTSPGTIFKVLILALVSIFGSIGNFMVVGNILKNPSRQRPPFYFLLSIGVTDLSRAAFCLPIVMATALQGSLWRHGTAACKMFAFAASFFTFSTLLSLLVIAIERHVSTVYPKTYNRHSKGFLNLIATISIWITALLLAFPPTLHPDHYDFIPDESQCTYKHKHYSKNDGINYVISFVAMTSLTYFLYYRIFVFMRSHRRMCPLQPHIPAFSTSWAFWPGGNHNNNNQGVIGDAAVMRNLENNSNLRTDIDQTLDADFDDIDSSNQRLYDTSFNGSVSDSNNRYDIGFVSGYRHFQPLNVTHFMKISSARHEHVTRLCFLVTLTHGVCWLPYIVLSLMRVFGGKSEISTTFVTFAAWLSHCQVVLCPVVFFLCKGRSSRRKSSRIIRMEPWKRKQFLIGDKIIKA